MRRREFITLLGGAATADQRSRAGRTCAAHLLASMLTPRAPLLC
jgi:hypothetical protein